VNLIKIIAGLLLLLANPILKSNTMHTPNLLEKIIQEYTPEYCFLLEEIYGKGMMSEGEAEGIEHMFSEISLNNKKMLDIGSGLGGVALYLADTYNADVTGIDINPWMIAESTNRIPYHLQSKICYKCITSNDFLDFPDSSFDIVFSKNMLTHIDHKEPLFKEIKRVLKPDGILVITDCLSPVQGVWGPHMNTMATTDGLTIFAHTKQHYRTILTSAGFKNIEIRDDSLLYKNYNEKICNNFLIPEKKEKFIKEYGENSYQENLKSYQAVVDAFELGEVIMFRFTAYAK
jgi:phosphoethanolamine N-methyltransferase